MFAAAWAALLSYLPVAAALLLTRLAGGGGDLAGALHLGLAGWLLGHGVPLLTSSGPFDLAPLAVGGLAAWRVVRAGVHATRAVGARRTGSPGRALTIAGAVGVAYGVLGVLGALLLSSGPEISPLRAGATLTLFGWVAAALGALHATGALDVLARQTHPLLVEAARTGLVAALLLLAAGAAAAGLAIAVRGGPAADMIGAYQTGPAGQAGIILISLAYAPNAAVWAASYLLGPGFAVGAGTTVRTTEVDVGTLPAVPLLAGLPEGPAGGFGALLLTVPVLAGIGAGMLLAARVARAGRSASAAGQPPPGAGAGRAEGIGGAGGLAGRRLLGCAALGGPIAAALLAAAAAAAGGSLGAGRLAQLGPTPWQVLVAAALALTIGTTLGAALRRVAARR